MAYNAQSGIDLIDAAVTEEWARLLRTLAHPTRLMILLALAKEMKCVGDIRELVHIPQPNVSQHLALLKESGLVISRKQGARRCYSLADAERINGILSALGSGDDDDGA